MLIQRHAYTPLHSLCVPLFFSLCVCILLLLLVVCFCCCGYCGGGCCFLQLVIFCPTMYLRIDNLMWYEKKGHRIKNDGSAIIMFFLLSFVRSFACFTAIARFPVDAYRCIDTHTHTHISFLFFSHFLFLSIERSFCIGGIIAKQNGNQIQNRTFW